MVSWRVHQGRSRMAFPSTRAKGMTARYLRSILEYEPMTGRFVWLRPTGARAKVGALAGSAGSKGRRSIKIGGQAYLASRLAVLWMTGSWPRGDVDHKDMNCANDRWDNLRDTTHSLNLVNRFTRRKHNLPRGVTADGNGTFCARITVGGRCIYLGTFATPDEAHQAYLARAIPTFGDHLPV